MQGGRCSIVRDEYLVSKWALIRRNELVDIPDRLKIHPDFLQKLSHAEFESAFKEIGKMFYQMYSDIADSPQRFGLPLYKIDEYDYFSYDVIQPFVEFICHKIIPCGADQKIGYQSDLRVDPEGIGEVHHKKLIGRIKAGGGKAHCKHIHSL